MSSLGPGDKPKVVRRRAAQQRRQQRVQQQTANARPLSATPVKPKQVQTTRSVQDQTRQAKPLSPRPVRPQQVRPPRTAKPLASVPPQGVRAGKPVVDAKQRRGVAVTAYNQLSGAAKQGHLAGARKRALAGKPTETDVAILHAHDTRVKGNRKRADAVKAFDALTQPTTGLHLDPRVALAQNIKPHGLNANVGSVANLPSVGKVVAAIGPVSTAGLKSAHVPKVIANIPADLAENVITSPSSVAKFATTAVKHPGQAAKALAQPYKDLAHDPKKFVEQRPVTTALMLSPAAVTPGRLAGKVARLAGKQTLKREAATLEHTALRETRTGSRGVVRRAVQARRDAKAPAPSVTARQIDTRVDEAFAGGQKHAERVRNHILHDAQQKAKDLPKDERQAHMLEAQDQARKAVVATKRTHYSLEFGATPKVENGRVVEQPNAATGHLHDTLAEAQQVRDHLNEKVQTIKRGSGSVFSGGAGAKLYSKEDVPVQYRVIDAGHGKYAVMPNQAAERLSLHGRIGREKAVPAVVLRQTRRMLSKAVLPYHPTWLSGQGIEGTVRSAIAGAGPTSWMRAHRYQARQPDLYKALAERATPGGQLGRVVATEMTHRTLAEEIPDSLVARRFTELGQKPGIKQARALNDAVTNFIFEKVNGRFLEGIPQKAMLGKALKDSPLMERRVLGLSNKAMDEAAKGLKGTETQVALAREVERSFGKYAGFSPRLRSLIMHWTPFIPWYMNTARFLLQTLPRDHPLAAGLIADINTAEEDWRKQQGLSLRYRNQNTLPPWMLGGYPVQGGKNLIRIGHYTPAGVDPDITGSVSGLLLPQFAGTYAALQFGKDWKGDDLKHADGSKYNEGERALYAAAQLIEALTPGTAQAAQVLHAPEVLGGPSDTDTSTLKDRVLKQVRPISSTPVHRQKSGVQVTPVKVKRVRVRPVKVG